MTAIRRSAFCHCERIACQSVSSAELVDWAAALAASHMILRIAHQDELHALEHCDKCRLRHRHHRSLRRTECRSSCSSRASWWQRITLCNCRTGLKVCGASEIKKRGGHVDWERKDTEVEEGARLVFHATMSYCKMVRMPKDISGRGMKWQLYQSQACASINFNAKATGIISCIHGPLSNSQSGLVQFRSISHYA